MREIEIKLKASDLEAVAAKLGELGCALSEPVHQEDINFIHKDDVKWFETTSENFLYPRLRIQTGKSHTFTVKKPLTNEMDCIEHELQIDDVGALRSIMELFGYKEGVTVRKQRRTCVYGDYAITLDEVEQLGSFVEIERVVEDGDPGKIQSEMFAFAKEAFGLEEDRQVMKGYDILRHYANNTQMF